MKGEDESEEKKTRKGRTRRSKGWWQRGDVGAYQNAGNMTCWTHKESAAQLTPLVDEEKRKNMETAWEAEHDKDECIVKRNYWLGSEHGCWGAIGSADPRYMLGCYWFCR